MGHVQNRNLIDKIWTIRDEMTEKGLTAFTKLYLIETCPLRNEGADRCVLL